jgi:ubiquinone/menaquinone biosynthesis C-methylase UbiE
MKATPEHIGRLHKTLSRIKFVLAGHLSPQVYWHLMGRFRAVPAVTSQFSSLAESMDSGSAEANLLDRLGLLRQDARTLQIGSGLGRIERALSGRVAQCYGCDISAAMVGKASALTPLPNVTFVRTTGKDLSPWGDASIDVVYSFLVFQHLPRKQVQRYLAECYRVLKHGGSLVFQLIVDELGDFREPPDLHPYGLRYYRREQVATMLTASGMRNVRSLLSDGTPDNGVVPRGDVIWISQR